jgi:phosphate-selective porin OprO/OprP
MSDMGRLMGFRLRQILIFSIFGGVMSTQVLSAEAKDSETDSINMSGTLIFQREGYRGVLTDDGLTSSSSFLRKADIKAQLTLFDNAEVKVKIKGDGSGELTVSDTYINFALTPALSIKAGRFDPEFGQELTVSTNWTTAIERSSIYDLLALSGDGSDGEGISLNYSDYAFHGNLSAYDIPNTVFYSSRLVYMPINKNTQRLLLGYSTTYTDDLVANDGAIKSGLGFWSLGDEAGTNTIKLAKSVGGNVISENREAGVELAYQNHNTLFQAEYIRRDYTSQDSLVNTLAKGYSLQLAYTLTGEPRRFKSSDATYKGIKPKNRHGAIPGAWEVFFRHEGLKVGQDSYNSNNELSTEVRRANVNTIGLNWYFREDIRISTSYSQIYAPADDNDVGEIRGSGMSLRTLLVF